MQSDHMHGYADVLFSSDFSLIRLNYILFRDNYFRKNRN
jgi:hypothetical protein